MFKFFWNFRRFLKFSIFLAFFDFFDVFWNFGIFWNSWPLGLEILVVQRDSYIQIANRPIRCDGNSFKVFETKWIPLKFARLHMLGKPWWLLAVFGNQCPGMLSTRAVAVISTRARSHFGSSRSGLDVWPEFQPEPGPAKRFSELAFFCDTALPNGIPNLKSCRKGSMKMKPRALRRNGSMKMK